MKYNNAHIKPDNIGDMRQRLSLRAFTTSRNASGEELRSWGELAEVWGAVEHKTGGSDEGEESAQTVGVTSAVFRIRHRTDLNEKMMIVWNSRAWNIRSLLPDYDKTYLLIECEHYVGNAFESITGDEPDLIVAADAGWYSQEFAAHASATITVTVAALPSDRDQIEIYFDTGQVLSPNYWSHSGNVITLTFTPAGDQSIWVKFYRS